MVKIGEAWRDGGCPVTAVCLHSLLDTLAPYSTLRVSQWGWGLGTSPQSESVLSLLYFGWGKWVVHISVLDKMGAAAEWTEPRGTLRSRLRATLSRAPGAPLPVLLLLGIYSNVSDAAAGDTVRVICLVVLAGPSPATPKKGGTSL